MYILSWPETFREILCDDGGIPVTGSSLVLSLLIDHDGVIRRSDEVVSDTTRSGTSAMARAYRGVENVQKSHVVESVLV